MTSRPPPPPMPKAPAAGAAPVVRMPPADPTTQIAGTRSEHRVKMNRMRLKIASRLKEAQNTNAMLTTFNELDMSNIMQLRKENQDAFVKKHGIKMGFMSAFVKASAYALTKQPTVNAVIDGQETLYRDYVDISVAVATPKGLWSLSSEMLKACLTLTLRSGLLLWDKRPRIMSWLWKTWTVGPSPLVMEACSGRCLARPSSTLPSLPSSVCTECSRDLWSGTDRWSSDP